MGVYTKTPPQPPPPPPKKKKQQQQQHKRLELKDVHNFRAVQAFLWSGREFFFNFGSFASQDLEGGGRTQMELFVKKVGRMFKIHEILGV